MANPSSIDGDLAPFYPNLMGPAPTGLRKPTFLLQISGIVRRVCQAVTGTSQTMPDRQGYIAGVLCSALRSADGVIPRCLRNALVNALWLENPVRKPISDTVSEVPVNS